MALADFLPHPISLISVSLCLFSLTKDTIHIVNSNYLKAISGKYALQATGLKYNL